MINKTKRALIKELDEAIAVLNPIEFESRIKPIIEVWPYIAEENIEAFYDLTYLHKIVIFTNDKDRVTKILYQYDNCDAVFTILL